MQAAEPDDPQDAVVAQQVSFNANVLKCKACSKSNI